MNYLMNEWKWNHKQYFFCYNLDWSRPRGRHRVDHRRASELWRRLGPTQPGVSPQIFQLSLQRGLVLAVQPALRKDSTRSGGRTETGPEVRVGRSVARIRVDHQSLESPGLPTGTDHPVVRKVESRIRRKCETEKFSERSRNVYHRQIRRVRPQRPEPSEHVSRTHRDAKSRRHVPRLASQRVQRRILGPAGSGNLSSVFFLSVIATFSL